MKTDEPRPILLKDYVSPDFLIHAVRLEIELHPHATRVRAVLDMERRKGAQNKPLVLDGEKLTLHELRVNGVTLGNNLYQADSQHLIIPEVPQGRFQIETLTSCAPEANSSLTGLYLSNGIYCTQCEAEGFRRITYYLDRPDIMAVFTTRIIATKLAAPVLLSNGNLVESGELPDGRHYAEWHDPFPKPSYLFAMVGGRLGHVEDQFVTQSGRKVTLKIFVDPGNEERCGYAMDALKRAMRWDEEAFGREYDLDIFMIVAVSAFNMGAMENKGLNVFNDKYILARPDVATDADYAAIESIVAHEYFHNWTGNRITCRDWFQLCLKEGLTVFRDQEFTSDMRSRAVTRINDVRALRNQQFAEDGGPLAHPVRPSSYIEINNFYTATVYEKGAELARMIHTLVGAKRFRHGMDLYFDRHDGEAATVEDFLHALADGAKIDLTHFARWYSQAGTPEVIASGRHDAARKTYSLKLAQICPATPGQSRKEPLHIPVTMGLIGEDGKDIKLQLDGEDKPKGTSRVLNLTEREQSFRFRNVSSKPVPSLLREFSAPVRLTSNLKDRDWAFLMANDSDPFNRWEATQRLATSVILSTMNGVRAGRMEAAFAAQSRKILGSKKFDADFIAQLLTLPSEQMLAQTIGKNIDVEAIHVARESFRRSLAHNMHDALLSTYHALASEKSYNPDAVQAGQRSLRNACLSYLVALGEDGVALAMHQFHDAANMTDQMAALALLVNVSGPEREVALAHFYAKWQGDHLVMDKWLMLQATSSLAGTLAEVKKLTGHKAFTIQNPNKVRALIGSFANGNQLRFHDASGAGYTFISDKVLELDALNPQVAARLLGAFKTWRQFEPRRRALMKQEIARISGSTGLSRDVYEIALKTLS
jgi:aminopeptidase N